MIILTINAGSSSLKISIFEKKKSLTEKAFIHIDGISKKNCHILYNSKTHEFNQEIEIKNHSEALEIGLFTLLESEALNSLEDISAIGHRIVHGGELYKEAIKIDKDVLKNLEKISSIAPLHNPVNIESYKESLKYFKKTPQIAIFDTAFNQSIEEKNYLYAIPKFFYKDHKIRKYGFHGISHNFVTKEALKLLKNDKAKIISCHIGNGASITATIGGKAIDTSMGFTPLEGIIMGTRSGSIDPGLIFHILDKLKISSKKLYKLLNEESGLKAISEISHDMREIYASSLAKDEKAILAIEMLSSSIKKTIGAYLAELNGADAIVFTGGLGEKAFYVREKALSTLKFAGIEIDKTKNKKNELEIHKTNSKTKIFIIKSDEQKEIAIETHRFLENSK